MKICSLIFVGNFLFGLTLKFLLVLGELSIKNESIYAHVTCARTSSHAFSHTKKFKVNIRANMHDMAWDKFKKMYWIVLKIDQKVTSKTIFKLNFGENRSKLRFPIQKSDDFTFKQRSHAFSHTKMLKIHNQAKRHDMA